MPGGWFRAQDGAFHRPGLRIRVLRPRLIDLGPLSPDLRDRIDMLGLWIRHLRRQHGVFRPGHALRLPAQRGEGFRSDAYPLSLAPGLSPVVGTEGVQSCFDSLDGGYPGR